MKKIVLPEKPVFLKGDQNQASFEIKGCYPGYGNTLGNALRRVMLSSLPGFAITKIKIKGVDHEFSTIEGIKENIIELILNLKKLRFKMHKDGPVKVKINASGEKIIKGADIKAPSSVEIVSKDLVIASLTSKKSKLDMELTIEKGIGYSAVESREVSEKKELGVISIDALFTPIRKINYKVENMRVGKRTDFDKILLEIETDGSISPQEAFEEASKILVKQFLVLSQTNEKKVLKEVEKEMEENSKEGSEGVKSSPFDEFTQKEVEKVKNAEQTKVEDLNLSKRLIGILQNEDFQTVAEISRKSEEELKKIEGIGEKGIKEVKKAIGGLGVILEEHR
ncbi:MAG: DNA-directed RNA polymerase subunit alpha [Candidatus Moranbacteria bacterium]|nr:DNA-directed RNA polymerase subunit alpha [Candidatus Moranbacteria bacterium]